MMVFLWRGIHCLVEFPSRQRNVLGITQGGGVITSKRWRGQDSGFVTGKRHGRTDGRTKNRFPKSSIKTSSILFYEKVENKYDHNH